MIGLRAIVVASLLGSLASIPLPSADEVPSAPASAASPYRSPTHLCATADGTRLYVASPTSDSVLVVDVAGRAVVGEIAVGHHPVWTALAPGEGELYVACRYAARVDVVDLGAGRVVRSLPVALEPYGLVPSADGAHLYVGQSMGDSVTCLRLRDGATVWKAPVGRDPRAIIATPDGERLLVGSGLGRRITILDAATGEVREERSLGRGNLVRDILCSPDGGWAVAAHVVSHEEQMTLQMERGWIHSNGFSLVDLAPSGGTVTLLLDELLRGAANPWGLAWSPDGARLYVTLAGVHEVAIVDLPRARALAAATVGKDAVRRLSEDVEILAREGIARRVPCGGLGPRDIVYLAEAGELVVANYFSEELTLLDPLDGTVRGRIPLGSRHDMTPARRGELLFNDAVLCFQNWFSCASCHQEDASLDGLAWDLANDGLGNPKSAKSLHNAFDSAPSMWGGVRKDFDAAVAAGQRFLGFLPQPDNHVALLAFLRVARQAPNPFAPAEDPAQIARGEQIFFEAACVFCHVPPAFRDGKAHEIVSPGPTDLRREFVTPSLRECYRTAPYLHDGRAATLEEIFTDHDPELVHATGVDLTADELNDLVAYLRTL